MPDKPDRRLRRIPLKLRAVSMSEGTTGQPSNAGIRRAPGTMAAPAPAASMSQGMARPAHPDLPAGQAMLRPSTQDGARRIFTSWQSSSRRSDADAQEDGGPVATLPRTRYRFGPPLYDEYASAALPPVPALARGQRDPIRIGIEIWRGLEKPGRFLAARRASPTAGPVTGPLAANRASGAAPGIKRPKD